MKHYLINITYNGAPFSGWQRLKNKKDTIQQIIEEALSKLLKEDLQIRGSGRTDAKVNAVNQYADFYCNASVNTNTFIPSLNSLLPQEIRIRWIRLVGDSFHSRKSCSKKTYQYCISLADKTDVFSHKFVFQPTELMLPDQIFKKHITSDGIITLNETAMQKAAAILLGTHDFSAFTSDKSTDKSHIRELYDIKLIHKTTPNNKDILVLEFTGSGFLYNMIRILAGTLLFVGLDQFYPEQLISIMKAGKREYAGPTLPAHALFLLDVCYDTFD